jgi:hypothetical protein
MSSDRRKRLLLAVLIVILAAALYRAWPRPVSTAAARSNLGGTTSAVEGETPRGPTGLNLDALTAERPKPVALRRNLFRFAEVTPASGRSLAVPSPRAIPQPLPAPPPPAAGAQTPLTLIGIVETPGRTERTAVLRDGRGVYHGREGDIIEGRYRILRIATDSIEVSRIDSDTRDVIRLSRTTVP